MNARVGIALRVATSSLAYPWPDLDRALCHPALTPMPKANSNLSAFLADANGFSAQVNFPRGRPFVDRLIVSALDDRHALHALETKQLDVVVGADTQQA